MKRSKTLKSALLCIISLVLSLAVLAGCGKKADAGDYYLNAAPAAEMGENYRYDEITENDFTVVSDENKTSTFSLDRNTASYSLMRRQINDGLKLSEGSVRVEEYINYFNYNYDRPKNGEALAISNKLFDCPWNIDHKLLSVGIAAEELTIESQKPNNLVFLLDVSGSMIGADRLGLVQQAFTMLLDYLKPEDTVSIVTYAGSTALLLDGARGTQKTQIAAVLQDLQAGGSTAGSKGIEMAYAAAQRHYSAEKNNRVILATDGDFNVGISSTYQLKKFIAQKRESGVYLSVLGVGMNNTNDSTMKALAENGNGNYAYLDSVAEARKVLISELGGTMNVVAKNAKINLTFNPQTVKKFRLIGYESKMMSIEDFENENKDAGEIGSGHTVTALYEIGLCDGALQTSAELASAEIRYQTPELQPQNLSITEHIYTSDYTSSPDDDGKFISCVAEYGLLLRNSKHKGAASFEAVLQRLSQLDLANDQFKSEFAQIVAKASQIYSK